MELVLYQNSAEKNRVNKAGYLSLMIRLDGYMREITSIVNPSITIELNSKSAESVVLNNELVVSSAEDLIVVVRSKIFASNYVYIPEFNRYYFIDDIEVINNRLWRIYCSVDALMSFKDEILELNCLINRQEWLTDGLIVDSKFPVSSIKLIDEYIPEDVELREGETPYTKFTGYEDASNKYRYVIAQVKGDDTSLRYITYSNPPSLNSLVIPDVDVGATANNYAINTFVDDNTYLDLFLFTAYKRDDFASTIFAINIYPFDVTPNTEHSKYVIGHDPTGRDILMYSATVNGTITIKNSKFIIRPIYDNFLDYDEFTTIDIYIPYYGWVNVPPHAIYNKELQVSYVCSLINNSAVVYITDESNGRLIFSGETQLGISIPKNTSNNEELALERDRIVVNTANNALANGVSYLRGIHAAGVGKYGNFGEIAGSLAPLTSAMAQTGSIILNTIVDLENLREFAQCGVVSGENGVFSPQDVRVRVIYPTDREIDIDQYGKQVGFCYGQFRYLRELTGFTVVGSCHLENIPTATSNELNQIETALKSGVIL